MQLVGNIGKVHRLIYFVLGLAAIASAWIAHDLMNNFEVIGLLILGAVLLWSARSGH